MRIFLAWIIACAVGIFYLSLLLLYISDPSMMEFRETWTDVAKVFSGFLVVCAIGFIISKINPWITTFFVIAGLVLTWPWLTMGINLPPEVSSDNYIFTLIGMFLSFVLFFFLFMSESYYSNFSKKFLLRDSIIRFTFCYTLISGVLILGWPWWNNHVLMVLPAGTETAYMSILYAFIAISYIISGITFIARWATMSKTLKFK